jgi:hypothetical protein
MKFQEVRSDTFVRVLVGIERMRKYSRGRHPLPYKRDGWEKKKERTETKLKYAWCTFGTESKEEEDQLKK